MFKGYYPFLHILIRNVPVAPHPPLILDIATFTQQISLSHSKKCLSILCIVFTNVYRNACTYNVGIFVKHFL